MRLLNSRARTYHDALIQRPRPKGCCALQATESAPETEKDQDRGETTLSMSTFSCNIEGEVYLPSNQSWKADRQPTHVKGIHEFNNVDRLVAKMDLLMKKLESPH